MQRFILYDSGCAQCDDLAAKIEKESGGALVGMSLYAREAKQWLDRARPGWKFEPTLLEVDGDTAQAFTGMGMRAHMLTFLNPVQLLKIARVVHQAGVPLFGAADAREPNPALYEEAAQEKAEPAPEPEAAKPEMPGGFSLTHIGPDIGEHTPVESVTTRQGEMLALRANQDQNTLLLFFSTSCPYCHSVAQALAEYTQDAPERIIITFGAVEQDKLDEFLDKHQLQDFLVVVSPETRAAFGVTGVPYGFALDGNGVVRGKGIVNNNDHLDSLANTFYVSVEAFKQALASRSEDRIVVS
jgi:methylamine dehydrogenase accessory protein MauD